MLTAYNKKMKAITIAILILFLFSLVKAQSAFDDKTQVTASDGTTYTIKKLESTGQSLRVRSSQNSLAAEMAKYPDTRNELARTTQFYANHFTTPLNKLFNKEKLLSFRDTRLKFFAIADRSGTIREVYFYISKRTAITVDDLRKIELMIKVDKMSFFRSDGTNRPVRSIPIDQIPEFNGIPYFTINTFIDFNDVYKVIPRVVPNRDGSKDIIWVLPNQGRD